MVRELFEWSSSFKPGVMLERSFVWGQSAISGLVVGISSRRDALPLLDGKSLYAWLLAFVPRTHREKLATRRSRSRTWSTPS